MGLRIAFAGFRHGHILEVYELARKRDAQEVVAACEEHEPPGRALAGPVALTHASCDEMFAQADFDVLAVGDYYGRRGELLVRALEAGKHVISDKPICTRPEELDRIAQLSAGSGLSVGCQLSMRDDGNFRALRQVVSDGRIGEVHTICFSGQHPLLRGKRPGWYFEPGKHGGTINDIAIHAMDAIGWMTGRRIVSVVAARAWNARGDEPSWFQDGAQLMGRLDNDGGVLGDVSYLAPDACGYKIPQYWRFTLHGGEGLAETSSAADGVTIYGGKSDKPAHVRPAERRRGGYLEDFLNEIHGRCEDGLPTCAKQAGALTTSQVLASSRLALLAQRAADENLRDVACE